MPGSVPKAACSAIALKCTETESGHRKASSKRLPCTRQVTPAEVASRRTDRPAPQDPLAAGRRGRRDAAPTGRGVQPGSPCSRSSISTGCGSKARAGRQVRRAELKGPDSPSTSRLPAARSVAARQVIFVKPPTETGGTFTVRAEVENRRVNGSWLLSPACRRNAHSTRPCRRRQGQGSTQHVGWVERTKTQHVNYRRFRWVIAALDRPYPCLDAASTLLGTRRRIIPRSQLAGTSFPQKFPARPYPQELQSLLFRPNSSKLVAHSS